MSYLGQPVRTKAKKIYPSQQIRQLLGDIYEPNYLHRTVCSIPGSKPELCKTYSL